jgi:hypothetical protein
MLVHEETLFEDDLPELTFWVVRIPLARRDGTIASLTARTVLLESKPGALRRDSACKKRPKNNSRITLALTGLCI